MRFFSDPIGAIRANKKHAEGDNLTYSQAMAFADYLISKYGLFSMLTLCLDARQHFKDVFQTDYDTEMQLFVEKLLGGE